MLLWLALMVLCAPVFANERQRAIRLDDYEKTVARGEAERRADELREQAIVLLKGLVADTEGPRKAIMLHRLANTEFEHGKSLYLDEMEAYNAAFGACFDKEACDPDQVLPAHTNSHFVWKETLQHYRQLALYTAYDRLDEATFQHAQVLTELGEPEQALAQFKVAARLAKTDETAAAAYLFIGEYYFDRDQVYPALLHRGHNDRTPPFISLTSGGVSSRIRIPSTTMAHLRCTTNTIRALILRPISG